MARCPHCGKEIEYLLLKLKELYTTYDGYSLEDDPCNQFYESTKADFGFVCPECEKQIARTSGEAEAFLTQETEKRNRKDSDLVEDSQGNLTVKV